MLTVMASFDPPATTFVKGVGLNSAMEFAERELGLSEVRRRLEELDALLATAPTDQFSSMVGGPQDLLVVRAPKSERILDRNFTLRSLHLLYHADYVVMLL